MAPPALYIVGGVVVAAGAVIAFKELVYDPYIHPRVEAFLARRDARRMARAHVAEAQLLVEPREVAYAVRQQRRAPIEMSDVRRRPRWADSSPASARSSSPLPPPLPRPVAPFGLQTPQESPAPLVDLAPAADPFADPAPAPPLPRRTGSSPTTHETPSTVPSLLRSPPPAVSRSPAVHAEDDDDDDDLVLSFISDRLRAARRSGASSPDLIRLAPPSPVQAQSPRLTSETFVPPLSPPVPRSPSQHTLSSSSSRALSPFDEDIMHGALVQQAPLELRRSVLSPVPSSSLTAARPPSYDSRPVSPWSELDDFDRASQARSPRSPLPGHEFDTLSSHTLSEFDFGTTTDSDAGGGADDEFSSPRARAGARPAADFDVRSVSSNEL